MKRQIIFRGKRINPITVNKRLYDWSYGLLTQEYGKYYVDGDEVEEDTIGQFTGLHDKNNCPIYEGDNMRRDNDEAIWVVEWNEQNAGFYFKKKGHRYLEPSDCSQSKFEDDPIRVLFMAVIPHHH